MALPAVSVSLRPGGLGLVAPADAGVVGLIAHGLTTPANQRTVGQYFSYDEVSTYLTATTGEIAYKNALLEQVADFYRLAGTGAELWLLIGEATQTVSQLFDQTIATSAARVLVEAAEGRISLLGYTRQKPALAVTTGMADEVSSALVVCQSFATAMAAANTPLRIVLDGHSFTGDAAQVANLRFQSFNRVSVVLGRTATAVVGSEATCVGLVLGRLAGIPVQRNLGRVADGPVSGTAFLTAGGQPVRRLGRAMLASLHDKGYILLVSHYGRGGYYFSDDPTATTLSDDYSSLSNGRVVDKAHRLIYAAYLEELLGNVTVDEDTGRIVPSTLKYYQGRAERTVDLNMTNQGEISGVQAFVDPKQDVLGTGVLVIDVNIIPVGTNRAIKVRLGLTNPTLAR